MRKIESHFHVNLNGFSIEKIIAYLNKKKIEKCWLLTWEEDNPPIPSLFNQLPIQKVIEAYEKYPDRFIPFYAPDPKTSNVKEILKEYKKKGVKGCGELKVTCKWEDNIIDNYLNIISELNFPLIFHMEAPRKQYVKISNTKVEKLFDKLLNGRLKDTTKYYLSGLLNPIPFVSNRLKYFPGYLYDFDYLEKMIQKYPKIKFIGHGPFFWNNITPTQSKKYLHQRGKIETWGIIDKLLEENNNFFCDISGESGFNALTRDKKKVKLFLEKHHSKLIFGTDNTSFNFDDMLASYNLPKEKIKNIYYKNAEKIIV